MKETSTTVMLKPYTLTELADLYGLSKSVMRKWLLPLQAVLGERRGQYYTVAQVRLVFDRLGMPGAITIRIFS